MVLCDLYQVCLISKVRIYLEQRRYYENKEAFFVADFLYNGSFEDCPFLWEPLVCVQCFNVNVEDETLLILVDYVPDKYLDEFRD